MLLIPRIERLMGFRFSVFSHRRRSMRVIHVIALCSLSMASLGPTVSGPITAQDLIMAMPLSSAQGASSAAGALPGLVCIQNALGGARAFAGVSSLRITGETKPVASTGLRPLPGTREISVVFPDRYKNMHLGQFPGGGGLSSMVGFDGRVLLSSPRLPDEEASMRSARLDFARQMLMRLPRASAGVSLSQRVTRDAGQERLAIDASGPDGFQATLLANPDTCVPVALEYEGSDRFLGPTTVRVHLSEYRPFGGVRFPTVLKTSHGGAPYTEEHVSTIELNAPGADQYFAPDR
jgi:hypothetical protein